MSDLEKLSIYVPEHMLRSLDADAELFEIFRRDGRSVNRNKFLSNVLLGYHEIFEAERSRLVDLVTAELEDVVVDEELRRRVAIRISGAVSSRMHANRRVAGAKRLSLKPTRKTEPLIRDVLLDLGGSSVSRYFYDLLASYCRKASYERERIVFKEVVDTLERACQAGRFVSFCTTKNRDVLHRVIPYKIVVGQDERLNYLLCYEEENEHGPALSFRLCRIDRPRMLGVGTAIPSDVLRHLVEMECRGPQYAINDDLETCVRLTAKGVKTYQSIYLGRPAYERIEKTGDSGALYFFRCSANQLFLYFKRFGKDEAEVMYPESLRQRVIDFHVGALDMYAPVEHEHLSSSCP